MQAKLSDGRVRKIPVYGATMGMRLESVTLDRRDMEALLSAPPHLLHAWFLTLNTRFDPHPEVPSEGA